MRSQKNPELHLKNCRSLLASVNVSIHDSTILKKISISVTNMHKDKYFSLYCTAPMKTVKLKEYILFYVHWSSTSLSLLCIVELSVVSLISFTDFLAP